VLGGLVSERCAQQDGELALVYAPEAAALAACEVPQSRVEVGDRLLVLDAGVGLRCSAAGAGRRVGPAQAESRLRAG
jgi:hypothetical protein